MVSAKPEDGSTVSLNTGGTNSVRVEFDNGEERSRIDAWWDNGPQWQIREDG